MVDVLEEGASGLVGPVPFKDAVVVHDEDDGQDMISLHEDEEYADVISAMPSATYRFLRLRQYQGVWMLQRTVAGVISVQRRFTPRPGGGDVLLATPPKCGTTWLKALSFATMARTMYPPGAGDHPLLRLNPHECVPSMEGLFGAGQEAKLEALPSPRLLHTHMHHHLLPPSLAHDPDCKIVYVCREPKDMLVSLWHFTKSIMTAAGGGVFPFSDVLENACEGKSAYGPFWDHFLSYWNASKASPEGPVPKVRGDAGRSGRHRPGARALPRRAVHNGGESGSGRGARRGRRRREIRTPPMASRPWPPWSLGHERLRVG